MHRGLKLALDKQVEVADNPGFPAGGTTQ